jgi:hypothetical protein
MKLLWPKSKWAGILAIRTLKVTWNILAIPVWVISTYFGVHSELRHPPRLTIATRDVLFSWDPGHNPLILLLWQCDSDSFATRAGITRRKLFWLTDQQWSRIEPHLPADARGKERVDDRRVINGIVHVLKSGCRWCDCPAEYGPPTAIYKRFVRWAERGV